MRNIIGKFVCFIGIHYKQNCEYNLIDTTKWRIIKKQFYCQHCNKTIIKYGNHIDEFDYYHQKLKECSSNKEFNKLQDEIYNNFGWDKKEKTNGIRETILHLNLRITKLRFLLGNQENTKT